MFASKDTQGKKTTESTRGSARQTKSSIPPIVQNVLNSPGRPLDSGTRANFEARFGHDFSRVRVHANDAAARSAEAIGAKAYTVEPHLVFGKGRYEPTTIRGTKLLAHELTHVLQQRAGTKRYGMGSEGDALERHADTVSNALTHSNGMVAGLLRHVPQSSHALQRAPEDEADSPEQLRLPPIGINPEVDLPRSPMETAQLSAAVSHKVITFILGPDSDKFYKSAHEYWRQSGRTDVLVTNLRTLVEVLNYLNDNPSPNGRSWGQVNLVTHANEEGGMGIKLSGESSNNISPEELDDAVKAGAIPKVDGSAVDFHTAINVHGCAIGRNPQMLSELSQAISGGKSDVYGPKDLQGYRFSGSGKSEKTDEFLVEYWSVGFPAQQARSRKQLVQDLNEKYGSRDGMDWNKAISGAKTMTMPYHYEFTAQGFTTIPAQSDRAGHARLLQNVAESASWIRWSVKGQSSVVDSSGKERTTIDYAIQTKGTDGKPVDDIYTMTIDNPIPSDKQSLNGWLTAQIGPEKTSLFSWSFTTKGLPQSGKAGEVKLICEGKRTVVRVERDLKDATGAYQHPSREDPTHYGTFKP